MITILITHIYILHLSFFIHAKRMHGRKTKATTFSSPPPLPHNGDTFIGFSIHTHTFAHRTNNTHTHSHSLCTHFFRFLSCWCLCRFFAIVGTTFSMWIILKDFHCLVWFHRRVLFPMNDMTTNLQNLNHDDVGAESRHSFAASFILFSPFLLRLLLLLLFLRYFRFLIFYRRIAHSQALEIFYFHITNRTGTTINFLLFLCELHVSWFTGR